MSDDEREMLMEMPAVRELLREAVEEEREACASVAASLQDDPIAIRDPSLAEWDLSASIAAAIRARSRS